MKKLFYIDYPQEHLEGQLHTYRCALCKVITTKVNGRLEGHLPTCEYRIKMQQAGFEAANTISKPASSTTDEED